MPVNGYSSQGTLDVESFRHQMTEFLAPDGFFNHSGPQLDHIANEV